ncbi:hypothetical protein D2Q93_13385 [Alicyclobacillaceae bacterium I2511]|nr:hypothetical protein D2Q93_13385 [Alicyclobacillaceae bacterium I2511]
MSVSKNNFKQRMAILAVLYTLLVGVLLGRLFMFAVVRPQAPVHPAWPHSVTRIEVEHMHLFVVDDGRGRILYRNGQAISGRVLGPYRETKQGVGETWLVHDERKTAGSLSRLVGQLGLPDHWPDDRLPIAEQGRTGLEYTFDNVLRSHQPGYWSQLQDAKGRLVDGQWYRLPTIAGLSLRTTLHPGWQQVAESAMQQSGITDGAVVVLDTVHNEVLAFANRDAIHAWSIPAVTGQVPGSVFKLVTAAAALDAYRFRPQSIFVCHGALRVPGVNMACWRVHGRETMTEALAASCDVAFAEIGMTLGRQALQEVFTRLHLQEGQLQKMGGKAVLVETNSAVLFRHPGHDAGLLANTAIGQEDVRLSPLQGVNLASTIANHGWYRPVRLLLDAQDPRGTGAVYGGVNGSRAMSGWTAQQLGVAMRQAVTSAQGTAHALAQFGPELAAKTGTAELATGHLTNAWIVGFTPWQHPRFAFVVFVRHQPSAIAHGQAFQATRSLLLAYRQNPSLADIN